MTISGLAVKGLAVRHSRKGMLVLRDATLTVPSGQVTGIIGPNGAGKSTLLKAVCGILRPTSGAVSIGEIDVLKLKPRVRATHIGYVPQQTETSGNELTVYTALALGADEKEARYDIKQAVLGVAHQLDLSDLLFRKVGELSGGQIQRVLIGRALVRDTECILLDEPVNNLDLHYQVEIMHLLRHLAHDCGKAIAVVLHDMNLAGTFCDRLAVVADGTIQHSGEVADVLTADVVRALFGDVADVSHFGRPWRAVLPKREGS
ncbi:ABC transporter ATP-binding protein [Corynebacterium hindlerae]|uniref:ABC transporter ATP-binding protein n=1 Tax=Corynebacterium hindlerae TaxID=699041 RepID=UPI0031B6E9FB